MGAWLLCRPWPADPVRVAVEGDMVQTLTPSRPTQGRRPGRSTVLWLVGLAIAAVVLVVAGLVAVKQYSNNPLSSPCSVTDRVGRTLPSQEKTPFSLDFSTIPDGKLPSQLNGFEMATVGGEHNEYGLSVVNGRLCHGSPLGDNSASYLQSTLPDPVTRIGVTATFPEYAGSVALVVWQSSLVDADGKIPNAGIHFVIGANQWDFNEWHFGVWEQGRGESILASGTFASKGFNVPQTFQVIRRDDTVVVELPDGQSRTVTDPRIAAWTGNFPTWELYEFKAVLEPASINSIWAA